MHYFKTGSHTSIADMTRYEKLIRSVAGASLYDSQNSHDLELASSRRDIYRKSEGER